MQRVETLDELLVAEPSVLTPPAPAEAQDETEKPCEVLTHAVERLWRHGARASRARTRAATPRRRTRPLQLGLGGRQA
jgi:hypothetical protein